MAGEWWFEGGLVWLHNGGLVLLKLSGEIVR